EDGIRDRNVTGVQTCALPISANDIQTFQFLILRDKSLAGLKKARNHCEDACREGMYAKVEPITDQAEIARRLRGMTTMSADGLRSEERRVGKEWRTGRGPTGE